MIDPIIYDQKPTALFRANHRDSVASTISGTTGIFFMQETWNSVTLLNGSDRAMQLLGTGGVPNASINTLNSSMSSTPEAIINVSVDDGAEAAAGLPWRFDVKHIFPATDVRIESIRGPPSATQCSGAACNLTIYGDIYNIVGTTTIRNDRGTILAGPAGPTFYSNRAFLDSELGSIGTIPIPIRLVLFQITHTGEVGVPATFKDAVARRRGRRQNIYLELTVLRRSSTTASPRTSRRTSGRSRPGTTSTSRSTTRPRASTPASVGDVAVDIYTPNKLPDGSAPAGSATSASSTTNHFRPDNAPDNPDIVGCGTTSPCVVLVAYGTDSDAEQRELHVRRH